MFSEKDVILKMEGVYKSFGSVRVLEGVDLTPVSYTHLIRPFTSLFIFRLPGRVL